ncbi:MAG: branched-chain amino acid ABC transporter permease [Betaproteobacteria bacterium]
MPALLSARTVGLALLGVLSLVLPFFIYPVFLIKALCFALFACAFNLLLGYAGILSFGHAALFGGSAYVCAHAAKVWGLPTELALVAGTAAGAAMGMIYGVLAVRQRGIYLAMITFALAQMVYFIAVQAPFTGGEDGIQAVPRGKFLGTFDLTPSLNMYYFVLGVFVLALALIHRIIHSPFGQVLRAMRDNEQRAISLGYRTSYCKVMVFTMSGALSGLAGGLKSLALGIATLTDVYWHGNGEVILMTLLGGLGTFFGPVVGAVLVVGIQNYLAQLGAWVTIIQGFTFVVIVMAFRRGIVGELDPLVSRLLARKPGNS